MTNFLFCLQKHNHNILCLFHRTLVTSVLVTTGLRGPAPKKPSKMCLQSSSALKHRRASPTQPPAHSRIGQCWQRRKKAPHDRQNLASSAAVPQTTPPQAWPGVHQSIHHTPAFLSFSFQKAHSSQLAWHVARAGNRHPPPKNTFRCNGLAFTLLPSP